jgi:hypothetical protein
VLRLRDAGGSQTGVRPARAGLLRVLAHMPGGAPVPPLGQLRVLLVADLLARVGELRGLQVLISVTGVTEPARQSLERQAAVLGIRPPAAYAGADGQRAMAGGPPDVQVAGPGMPLAAELGGLCVSVGGARLDGQDGIRLDGRDGALAVGSGAAAEPLAARLALLSVPYHAEALVSASLAATAQETMSGWRHRVAEWAESPSRPVPPGVAAQLAAAFGELDTPAVLSLLRTVEGDAAMPAGAKFETFVHADRVLGLELEREIGRLPG